MGVSAQTAGSAQERREAVVGRLSHSVVIRGATNEEMTLASRMSALHVPAVSVAAIRHGEIDWAQGYGVAAIGGTPVTTTTLFGAASISKPVTAVGVMRLVEEGKVDLDADVNRYLKRWKVPESEFTAHKKVTVRELLNHTSGIGTHVSDYYGPGEALPTAIQLLNGDKPAKSEPVRVEAIPGTGFAYANGGYLILQILIEDVTGESFAAYMKRNVLDPMGMKDSTFEAPLPLAWQRRAATAYGDDGKWSVAPANFVWPNLAAGGLWCTPTDLARFLIEVRREYEGTSHKVLHQQTVRRMFSIDTKASSKRPWGLGFEVGGSDADRFIRHEGSAFFQDDMVEYLRGDGLVVMTSGGGGGAIADEVMRSAGAVYDFPDFKAVEHSVVAVAPADLARFVGTYAYVKVALEGDHLTAEIPAGAAAARLYAESPARFFVLDGPQELEFHVDAQGKVTGVEFIVPMGHHTLEKSPAQ